MTLSFSFCSPSMTRWPAPLQRVRWSVSLEFEPRDAWIGVFWRWDNESSFGYKVASRFDAWICLVPCLPIHVCRIETDVW